MLELRISYAFADPATGLPEPSAYVRVYLDACQAEVTHCYVGQRWQDVLGTHPPARTVFAHRLQMNTFLSKWLEHLRGAGHGRGWLPAEPATRSEEHTSELQSLMRISYAVFCLKKKKLKVSHSPTRNAIITNT